MKLHDVTLPFTTPVRPGHCRVRVYGSPGDHERFIVMTELGSNSGPSVTNASHFIARKVMTRFSLYACTCRWFKHYDADSYWPRDDGYLENVSEVIYHWEAGEPWDPAWRSVTMAELEQVIGAKLEPTPKQSEARIERRQRLRALRTRRPHRRERKVLPRESNNAYN